MKRAKNRRSEYGSRTLLTQTQDLSATSRKLLHSSVTDRIKYKFQDTNECDVDIDNDLVQLITGATWKLYRVSHLYNLSFTPVKLKQYATRINKALVLNFNKEIDDDIQFDVKVSKIPILKNNDDCFALKIEVYLCKESKENVLKFRSILLSWGEYTIENNICHLPFMMCMGPVNITKFVNTAICDIFDTSMEPLLISEDDIMWLSAMVNDADCNEDVCYDYKLNSINIYHNFSVSFPNKVVKKLWNEIHPPELEEISFQHVQAFHKHIQCQLIITYGMNFELFRLHKISVGNAAISCEGKIKMLTYDAVVKILTFINDISILLDTYCPKISNAF